MALRKSDAQLLEEIIFEEIRGQIHIQNFSEELVGRLDEVGLEGLFGHEYIHDWVVSNFTPKQARALVEDLKLKPEDAFSEYDLVKWAHDNGYILRNE